MGKHKKEALTDAIISKAAKRKGRFRLTDGGGLYLAFNNPNGKPTWTLRYRSGGKHVQKNVGKWPAMSLAQARAAVVAARKPGPLPGLLKATKPATQLAPQSKRFDMALAAVVAAAGAAMELVERMGFEWNGKRWIHGAGMP